MTEEMRVSVSVEDVASMLRAAGYRAVIAQSPGGTRVQSAAQGLGFFVAMGNPAAGEPGRHLDLGFQCLLAVQGELPPGLTDAWNRDMRFGRLFRQDDLLVLTLDLVVAGGVTDAWLQGQCELWDRLVRDFIRYLREPGGTAATSTGA